MLRSLAALGGAGLTLLALLPNGGGAEPITARRTLKAEETLRHGEALRSESGAYELLHQRDGNVVLYHTRSGQDPEVVWQTGTSGRSTTHLIIQPDGNLVLYQHKTPLWHTGTFLGQHHLNIKLHLANDGNLVITHDDKPIWTSGAAQRDRLRADEALLRGQVLRSPNGEYTLIHQGDGNVVLYRFFDGEGHEALWQTRTDRATTTRLVMQHDGNVVLYDQNRPVWYAFDKARGQQLKVELRLQDDGNLVAYEGGQAYWSTGTVQPTRPVRRHDAAVVTATAHRDFGNGHSMKTEAVLSRDKGVLDVTVRVWTSNAATGFRGKVDLMLLDEKRTRLWPAADAEPAQIAAMSVDAHTPLTQPSRERSFAFKVPPEEARKARKVWLYQSEEGSVLPGDIKDAIKRGRELYDLVNRE